LAVGRATVQSNVVLEKHAIDFAVLHFGDHNLTGAVNARMSDETFSTMREDLNSAFAKGDTTEVMRLMNVSFAGNSYSLWHLFADQRRRILYELLATTWQEVEASFRHIYEHNYTIMSIMRGMNMPLPRALSGPAEFILNQDLCRVIRDEESDPRALSGPAEFILNQDLCRVIRDEESDLEELRKLVDEATRLSLQLDDEMLRYEASRKINYLMCRLGNSPEDVELLETTEETIRTLQALISQIDVQMAQNVLFNISRETYSEMSKKAASEEGVAKNWVEHFRSLAQYLDVKVE
ncbi:MAG: DUF3536 domain-containing protein, partial [Planctomycetota bacterium]|jgi:hypothetical protein